MCDCRWSVLSAAAVPRIALCVVAAAKEGGLKTVLVQFAEDEVKNAWLRSIVEGEVDDFLLRRDRLNLKLLDYLIDYSFY